MNISEIAERRQKTLIIDPSWSYCGACNQGAFPDEKTHDTLAGYGAGRGSGKTGCGAEWTYVSSNYADIDGLHDRIREMRPDLEFWW